jgi:hypothetical protein
MPCPNPMQAYCTVRSDGKKDLKFSNVLGRMFRAGMKMPDDSMAVECGQCMTCRLERSRVTALRCVHESKMFEDNCFITLTFSDEKMKEMCPLTDGGYSLVREHAQLFMKRLRKKFAAGFYYKLRDGKERFYQSKNVRAYGCGEYGEKNGRPHFHFCLFNCFFPDREYEGGRDGFRYYSSKCLEGLWQFGFCSVSDFSFETAAYVARYVTKKVTGKKAVDHYRGRLPEFAVYPTRGGGLGKPWFDKYGLTDVIPTDSCIARYVKCGVPEYYDRLRGRFDPDGLAQAKKIRSERAKLHVDDNTYARLQDKEKCMNAKINVLIRRLEN